MPQALTIRTAPSAVQPAGIVVIYAAEGGAPQGQAAAVWASTGLDFAKVTAAAGFSGRQGQLLDLAAPEGIDARRLFVLGAGAAPGEPRSSLAAWTDRGGSLAAKLMAATAETVAVVLDEALPDEIAELAAGLRLRHYRFDKYKARRNGDATPETLTVTLHVGDPAAAGVAIADRMATVGGALLARDLVNEPANVLGTEEFAERARALTGLGVEVEVLGEAELAALNMHAMLAVAQGSARPPRLAIMRWTGGKPADAPVAFVGKGVVFDSGGISIKPAANMEDMKGDMGGAAVVTGLMHALATRQAKVNAVGLIGLVENMPSSTSMRPGDIVSAASGTTIEIVNTDAEGRLVLADVLWYAQQRFRPCALVDLATLTGAVLVALGHEHAGLFSNNDELAQKLTAAGLATGERVWRLPMGAGYDKQIESRFADIRNSAGRPAGAITAAQFLGRFVGDVPWAHLDILGVSLGPPHTETNTSWATGWGVTLLDRLVRDSYEAP
jgi:leucyl aminopeptidase